MPQYFVPKGISKTALKNAPDFKFSAARMKADHEAPDEIPCTRCAASIAKGINCDTTDGTRCKKCAKGNRGGCTKVCSHSREARVQH